MTNLPTVPHTPAATPAPATPAPASPADKAAAQPKPAERVSGADVDRDALMAEALSVAKGTKPAPVEGKEPPAPAEPSTDAQLKPKEGEEDIPPPPADLTQKKLSEGFAKLERQRRRDQKEFAAKTTELATRETALKTREAAIASHEAAMKAAAQDPLSYLKAGGWEFEELVNFVIQDGKVPPEVLAKRASEQHKAEIEKTKQEVEALKKQKQYEQDVLLSNEWERRTAAGIDAKLGPANEPIAHEFPTISFIEEQRGRGTVLADVLTTQAQHFQRTGQTLDPATALVHVERAYARMFPKLQARNPAQQGAGTPAATGAEKPRQITSSDKSDVSVPSDEELGNMTPEERLAVAVRVAKGSR